MFARLYHLAFLLILVLVTGPALANGEDYVFILKSRGNSYWTAVVDGIKETAAANHIKATIYQLENDSAAEEQLNTCLAAITQHPRFVAISSVTPAVGLDCMKEAVKRGVAVADMDANILPRDAEKAGFKLAFSVGSDNYLIGKKAAQYLKAITHKPNPKILVLEGAAGSVPGQKRADGFRDEIQTLLPKAQIVAAISADWDRLKAMNATSDILQREPQLDVIYGANDLMALGAVEAVRVSGKNGDIVVLGVDGTADARKAVLAGHMTATIAQLPFLIGKRAVEKALAVIENQATALVEITPTPVLDRAILQADRDPLLQYVR